MPQSRYRESRTLVRRLCRLPHQSRRDFRRNVARLREHFERFNVDVSELCQWLMGLRKRYGDAENPAHFGTVGDFLLEPSRAWNSLQPDRDETNRNEERLDAWRLDIFDDVAGFDVATVLGDNPLPSALREAMQVVSRDPRTPTADKLFSRLCKYDRAHRLVLLKSAAEWVVARYRRGVEYRERELTKWRDEKGKWEHAHPELTPAMCAQFTEIFKALVDPDRKGPHQGQPGIRRRNPRICEHSRLRLNKNNCAYGEKGHGPLCWKYSEFVKVCKQCGDLTSRGPKLQAAVRSVVNTRHCSHDQIAAIVKLIEAGQARRFNEQHFAKDAASYLDVRLNLQKRPIKGNPHAQALESVVRNQTNKKSELGPHAAKEFRQRFNERWKAYLKWMDLSEAKVIEQAGQLGADFVKHHGRLPHCRKIGETGEKTACEFNVHTELCRAYKEQLSGLDEITLAQEAAYREWRRRGYFAPPRKPAFRYPSSRELPTPKIFGDRYFQIDFGKSVLRLRLDDMAAGEWMEFGFIPWPRKYDKTWNGVEVTSIHVNFVGTRARAGLRFSYPHEASRFGCSQDEIDDLRSEHRRQTEDQAFLDAARDRLKQTFHGSFDDHLRLLAVDLGEPESGAYAAVYQGRKCESDFALEVLKIDAVYTELPETLRKDSALDPPPRFDWKNDRRGLRQPHVDWHVQDLSRKTKELAQQAGRLKLRRSGDGPPVASLRDHDFRRLTIHTAWMIRDWVRINAARMIAAAKEHNCDLIVLESLRDWKPPGYDDLLLDSAKKKRWLAMFSYGRIRRKVAEKAVERGLRVVTLPYHKSSQYCSACGHFQCADNWQYKRWRANKTGHSSEERDKQGTHWFRCVCKVEPPKGKQKREEADRTAPAERFAPPSCQCNAGLDANANAARVLARVFWDEIRLPPLEL